VPRWPVVSPLLDWFLSSILVTVVAAMLRVGFYFIDEEARLARTKKRATEVEAEDRERAIQ
jgi:Na+-transporting methylmalonyl-CoA/oxaloacetate decarboxylase gamma subunit